MEHFVRNFFARLEHYAHRAYLKASNTRVLRPIIRLTFRPRMLSFRPLELAGGVALGVFVSLLPFYGLHVLIAVFLARICSLNLPVAILLSFLSNPATFPVIILAELFVGLVFINFGQLVSGQATLSEFTDFIIQDLQQAEMTREYLLSHLLAYSTGFVASAIAIVVPLYFIAYSFFSWERKIRLEHHRKKKNNQGVFL